MNKTIKKALIIALIYLLGIGCVIAFILRAEQLDNQHEINTISYEVDHN